MRPNLIRGGLVASFLLLAVVMAQDSPRDRNAGRDADAPAAGDRAIPGGQPGQPGHTPPGGEPQTPADHFLAGYYAGYSDGYLDGGEDTAVAAADRTARLVAVHAADGHHPDQMQPGRRQARESLRAHMQGHVQGGAEPAGQAAGGEAAAGGPAVPEETVSGTVVGIKTVPIAGTEVAHRVVRLETEEGRRQVADLGPTDRTDKPDIKEEDQLRVRGVPVDTPDVRVIAGHRIFKGNREADVQYPGLNVPEHEHEQPGHAPQDGEGAQGGRRPGASGPGAGGRPSR